MSDGPLRGRQVAVATDTTAGQCAAALLRCLGTEVTEGDDLGLAGTDALTDWAASGAMALTGYADGPPRVADGAPASLMRAALAVLAHLRGTTGLPGVEVLGERAATAGLARNAPFSPGGTFRALPAKDGWLGVSLARDSDRDLLPALISGPVIDPWRDLTRWVADQPVQAADDRAFLLGLPAARVAGNPDVVHGPPMTARRGGTARTRSNPIVVDLSSLWAGPLCAHLLGLTGARVIKVESARRLDGARHGPTVFFDLLHAGHESVVLDLTAETGRRALRALVEAADLVVEASRPRALEQLGVSAAGAVARGVSWLSITAYGRTPANAMRVGFGDDVAAAAGLVCWDGPQPLPIGDAIADPLAGAVAAAAAGAALQSSNAWLIDVSMRDVAALSQRIAARHDLVTVSRTDDGWQMCRGRNRIPVTAPTARVPARAAVAPGADTSAVLSELLS